MKNNITTVIRKITICLYIFVFPLTVNAQEDENPTAKNAFTLSFGYHASKSQDLVYSPMIYDGNGLNAIGLRYDRLVPKGIHSFDFEYDNIEVSSTRPITFNDFGILTTREPSMAYQVNMSYGYASHIKSSEKFDMYFGGLVEFKVHVTDYKFITFDDEGYFFANTIHPWFRGIYKMNAKHSLGIEARIPLFSLTSRPTYAIVDNESIQHEGSDIGFLYQTSEFATVDKYRGINIAFTYSRQLSKVTSFIFRYRLDYAHYTEPLTISILKNNFDFGLTFKF